MLNDLLYPWLNDYWQQLQSLRKQSRLPHALMLKAIDGLGIEQLARTLGNSLLCQSPSPDGYACGQCSDCKLIAAGSHPDLHQISILEKKSLISVDQIRELVSVCFERPHQGGYRVAIINPSASMNIAAANALLKTLEEPGEDTLIMLVASHNHSLPATISSRCQLLSIYSPSEKQGLDWMMQQHADDKDTALLALRLSNHAPLKAIELLSSDQFQIRKDFLAGMARAAKGSLDPTKLIAKIYKNDIHSAIDWMYSLALDAQKLALQVPENMLVNSDQLNLLASLSSNNAQKIDRWIGQLIEARRLLATTSNINPQLIAEDLMFRWIAIYK